MAAASSSSYYFKVTTRVGDALLGKKEPVVVCSSLLLVSSGLSRQRAATLSDWLLCFGCFVLSCVDHTSPQMINK